MGGTADVIITVYLQRLREITTFRRDESSFDGWRRTASGEFRMRRHLVALTIVALSSLCLSARAVDAQEPSAAGLFQQLDPETGKSDGWFYIYERNGTYEGAIVRMFLKPGDPPNPLCVKCVGDQQNAPWLGLTIIKGMVRKGLEYEGGTILDPRYGQEWKALMHLSPDSQDLTVRGFLAIPTFGKDQYWKRLSDACYAQLDPTVTTKFKLTPPKPGAPAPKGKPAAGC
jgi:uncharacterized protein (DUF2147 family)